MDGNENNWSTNIIIAGGYNGYNGDDRIHVLNINGDDKDQYTLKLSDITCPVRGPCIIEITGGIKDEMLVLGYIKYLFTLQKFVNIQMPPIYIIQIIAKWYSVEMLHWMLVSNKSDSLYRVRKNKNHFAIPLKCYKILK